MNKVKIIEETAKVYNSNNRSVETCEWGNSCLYLGPGNKRCAFSRCCIDSPEVNSFLRSREERGAEEVLSKAEEIGLKILKEEYRGHSSEFWKNLQYFHDLGNHWDENGLTEEGEKERDHLIKKWA